MKTFKIDLHVHTVLSPCGDLMMTPGNIIKRALSESIDIMAVTDHNSAENVSVMKKMAKDTGLQVIPGMEVETREGVHLLCFFEELKQIKIWQDIIYKNLPDTKNKEEFFGPQIIVNSNDEYEKKLDKFLAAAVNLSINKIVKKVREIGGRVIPAHIDKTHGLIKNLGLIPEELEVPVLEIFRKTQIREYINKFPFLQKKFFVKNSDSHYLKELKPRMALELQEVSLKEIFNVLEERKGRKLFL